MIYSVKQLAKLSGITVRTLHHYDKIGLLSPAMRTEAGYRKYGEKELLRLQQILFFKHLNFQLHAIKDLLEGPDFDQLETLEKHKKHIENEQQKLSVLVQTIDNTIHHLKNKTIMLHPEELYQGLTNEQAKAYKKEAIEKYGTEQVETAERSLRQLTKAQLAELVQEQKQLTEALRALKKTDPARTETQTLIAAHYKLTRQFWGTHHMVDPQADAYIGLGELYVNDDRFTAKNGKADPEFAQFLAKAMRHFGTTQLS